MMKSKPPAPVRSPPASRAPQGDAPVSGRAASGRGASEQVSPDRVAPDRVAPDRVAVGRVLRPHGLKGEVVVEVLSDRPERFAPEAALLLAREGRALEPVRVMAARPHPSGLRLLLSGHQDRDAAEALRGASLEVPGADLAPAPPGAFYPHDLIGYACRDRREGDLGMVRDLIANGGGLLLVIEGAGRQLLVPFVDSFLATVDRGARTLELDLPEGLVETCASRS